MKVVKKIVMMFSIIALGIGLVACNNGNGSSQKVGVIDMQQLLQSPQVQQLSQQFFKDGQSDQSKLKAAYQQVLATRVAVSKATGAAKASLQAKLKKEEADFSAQMNVAQAQQTKQEQAMQQKIQDDIAKVANSEGLSAVYVKQVVLFGNTEDITDKVIKSIS